MRALIFCGILLGVLFLSLVSADVQCFDSDNGLNKFEMGITTANNVDYKDSCAQGGENSQWSGGTARDGDLIEYACEDFDGTALCGTSSCHYKVMKCDYGCYEGACLTEEPAPCSDSDGGEDFYVKGTATFIDDAKTDVCWKDRPNKAEYMSPGYGIGSLIEYRCYEPDFVSTSTTNCPNGCEDGACITLEEYCVDSDGGHNIYERGWINYSDGESEYKVVEVCTGEGSEGGELGTHVYEGWCEGANKMGEEVSCKRGCLNGKCVGFFENLGNWFRDLF